MSLNQYLNSQNADVAFISETKTSNCQNFANYITEHKANQLNSRQGGVALLVKKSLSHERLTWLEDDTVDALFSVVTVPGHRILVCSVYIPPSASRTLQKFLLLADKAMSELGNLKCNSMAIIGDLNARHANWGDQAV